MWTIWLIGAVVCGVIELMTQSVWTLCLSIGCVCALIASVCGVSIPIQLILLAAGSLAAFFLAHKYMQEQRNKTTGSNKQEMSSNMDALIGRIGRVTSEIKPGHLGRVQIDGDSWQARAHHESQSFSHGDQVKVLSYDSIIITVTKL